MTGEPKATERTGDVSYHSLRNKLNNLNYYQPLGHESVPLVDKLLQELIREAERFKAEQEKLDEHEKHLQEWGVELDALRQENPRLRKENTDLHKRLLSDSFEHDERKLRLSARLDAALSKLTHVLSLRVLEDHRVADLKSSIAQVRNHSNDLQRLGAADGDPLVAGGTNVVPRPPRSPALTMQGGPFKMKEVRHTRGTGEDAELVDVTDLSMQIQSLSIALSEARRQRADHEASLQMAVCQAAAARDEVSRLSSLDPEEQVPAGDAAPVSQIQLLVSELEFLERTYSALQKRHDDCVSKMDSSGARVQAFRREFAELLEELEAAHRLEHQASDELAARDHFESIANLTREQRKVADEQAEVVTQCQHLEAKIEEANLIVCSETQGGGVERLQKLQQELATVGRGQPSNEIRTFENQSEAANVSLSLCEAKCAGLSARLVAMRTHEAAQRQLLRTRTEEVSASQRVKHKGEEEMHGLSARVHELEASVQSAQSEVGALQDCLAEATTQWEGAKRECIVARREASNVQERTMEQEHRRHQLITEVEQNRESILAAEAKAAETRRGEEQLLTDINKLRRTIADCEETLNAVQRNHRELSAGVNRAVAELVHWRSEERSERAEVAALELLLLDAGTEKQSVSMEHVRMTSHGNSEEKRLEAAVAVARAAVTRITSDEESMREELMARLRILEPSLSEARLEFKELQEQSIQKLAIKHEQAAVAAKTQTLGMIDRGESRLHELANALHITEEQYAADVSRFQSASYHSGVLKELCSRLNSDLSRHQAMLSAEGPEFKVVFELESAASNEANACQVAQVELREATRQLTDLNTAEHAAEEGLAELNQKQQHLVSLLHGLEETRNRITLQLKDTRAMLDEERRLHESTLAGPCEIKQKLQDLAMESERLRRTLQVVDADRAELGRVTTNGATKLDTLRLELAQLQASRIDAQWSTDRLQRAADVQRNELSDTMQHLESSSRQTQTLEVEMKTAQFEVNERKQDAALGLEDLLFMTRENQILNDELVQLRRQDAMLSSKSEEHRALVLPRMQRLQDTEMERDRILKAYQQALEERQRNEVARAEIAQEVESAMATLEETHARLIRAREGEVEAQQRMAQDSAGILTIRARFSEASRTLEIQELARSEAEIERSRMQQDAGMRQAIITERYLKDSVGDAKVDALKIDVDNLQREFQDVQASAVGSRREKDEVVRQHSHLQSLLAQQRQAYRQLDQENALLRGLVGTSGEAQELNRPASSESTRRAVDEAQPERLRHTLAQQSALLAEMSTERRNLAEEVQLLRSEVSSGDP